MQQKTVLFQLLRRPSNTTRSTDNFVKFKIKCNERIPDLSVHYSLVTNYFPDQEATEVSEMIRLEKKYQISGTVGDQVS